MAFDLGSIFSTSHPTHKIEFDDFKSFILNFSSIIVLFLKNDIEIFLPFSTSIEKV